MKVGLVTAVLPVHPWAVGQIRRQVSTALTANNVTALYDETLLIVSELVTNAVQHARQNIRVSVTYRNPMLRIEVFDDSANDPELQGPRETGESGRGLALVAAAASSWGTTRVADGKIVWAEIRVDPDVERNGELGRTPSLAPVR